MENVILMTANDVSKYLHIGKTKSYELMKKPGFPFIKIGARYFVTKDALDSYLIESSGKAIL